MADVVDPATRSRMMRGIKTKNTLPEMLVRKGLHARGFRFRLHGGNLPGRPDLVLPKYRAVIFVHGCFWHGHDCRYFRWPRQREAFWRTKIEGNRKRDEGNARRMVQLGWRLGIVWECALRAAELQRAELISSLADWLLGKDTFFEASGAGDVHRGIFKAEADDVGAGRPDTAGQETGCE